MLRAEPAVFGPVASDPTVSRLIDKLAAGGPKTLTAIRSALADVRERVWKLAGTSSPEADGQVIVDLDGVLVHDHSGKQDAAATWKKSYGHHPLVGFADHGRGGTREPVAALLRPGRHATADTRSRARSYQHSSSWTFGIPHLLGPHDHKPGITGLRRGLGRADPASSLAR
jgi:hypothetical protein